ncbi:MAG: SDR family NAD(P)-dependent oxidoreductase [Faecalibacillus faecis]
MYANSYLNIYAASKAFVLNYSRALNEELKYRGIHVLAICPYWVETEFFDRAVEKDKKPVVIRYGKV